MTWERDILRERQVKMPKKKLTTEQIISKLREADVLISQGQTVLVVCKAIGVAKQMYDRCAKPMGCKVS
jgi:putative transposase